MLSCGEEPHHYSTNPAHKDIQCGCPYSIWYNIKNDLGHGVKGHMQVYAFMCTVPARPGENSVLIYRTAKHWG